MPIFFRKFSGPRWVGCAGVAGKQSKAKGKPEPFTEPRLFLSLGLLYGMHAFPQQKRFTGTSFTSLKLPAPQRKACFFCVFSFSHNIYAPFFRPLAAPFCFFYEKRGEKAWFRLAKHDKIAKVTNTGVEICPLPHTGQEGAHESLLV